MRKAFLAVLFSVILFSAAHSVDAQNFDYDRYKPRTLSELIELNNPKLEDSAKKLFITSGDWFHSQVKMQYVGTSRPLSAEHKDLLENWKKSFKISEKVAAMFENEFLFREGEKDFWLPVQKQVASYFPKELKKDEIVTLYLFFGGGVKTREKSEYLFLVNDFEKSEPKN